MRTLDDVARALALGATRVVLGTSRSGSRRWWRRLWSGSAPSGSSSASTRRMVWWRRTAGRRRRRSTRLTVARRMADLGVLRIVYTDIARDGTLTGVNVAGDGRPGRGPADSRSSPAAASRGLDDIRALAAHTSDGIEGVIVGQALYTATVSLPEALAIGRDVQQPA